MKYIKNNFMIKINIFKNFLLIYIMEKSSYYECKRCFYKSYQKNDMTKHLNKKKLCSRTFESFKYKDEDLYDLSLQRIKLNTKKFTCTSCNKNFYNNNNLKRHIEKSCKNKNLDSLEDESNVPTENSDIPIEASEVDDSKPDTIQIGNNNINNVNNSTINSNNNINLINNINISITKSFDEQWDTSGIDINKKFSLLFTNSKFTKTLENILENQVNLNVLIDNTSDNGIVFNDNKFVKMNVKEIVKQTMDKLHKHLIEFHSDIFDSNNIDADKKCVDFKLNLQNINSKYTNFTKSKDTQNIVKEYITDIYNKKKSNTIDYIEKGY
jgi:hypothetical protein